MYVRENDGRFKNIEILLLDFICSQAAFIIAYCWRHGWFWLPYSNENYLIADIVLCLAGIMVISFTHAYDGIYVRGYWKEFISILRTTVVTAAIAIAVAFVMKESAGFSRGTFIVMPVIYLVIDYGVHLLWKKVAVKIGRSNIDRSFIIIADEDRLDGVIRSLTRLIPMGARILKAVTVEEIVSGQMTSEDLIREWVDEIVISTDMESEEVSQFEEKVMEMGITLHRVLDIGKHEGFSRFYQEVEGYPVLTTSVREAKSYEVLAKRALDILGGVVGSFLCVIILIFVGPIVYIKDPGPVIFKQIRIGKNGKKFWLYKIRSMYKDAEARRAELAGQNKITDGMMFKIDDDPRILPGIGSFIRKWSLDEFPQFFNVLKGDMSLVGTRPPLVDEWEKYAGHHRLRLSIKPGITGLWQISGRSNIISFEEVLKLDMQYIYNWNFGYDLRILWDTVLMVIKRNGAE